MSASTFTAQRMSALDKANAVRQARSRLKYQIKAGEVSLRDVLMDMPSEIWSWPIHDALCLVPHWGSIRARRQLRRLDIPDSKPAGELTARQVGVVVQMLLAAEPKGRRHA